MTLYAPNGLRITGTLEHLQAQALMNQESAGFDDDGRLVFEYSGHTDCFWDTQEPVFRSKPWPDSHRPQEQIFLDEQGDEWFASQLTDIPPSRGDDFSFAPAQAGDDS